MVKHLNMGLIFPHIFSVTGAVCSQPLQTFALLQNMVISVCLYSDTYIPFVISVFCNPTPKVLLQQCIFINTPCRVFGPGCICS